MTQKKNYHHGDLRKKLIEAALEIISEQGLEKVSMRGLGQRLGVSRTAPYRHFTDKSALLCAIAEEGYKKLTIALKKSNSMISVDPVIRLKDNGIGYIEFAVANPVHYRIMFGNEILENKRTPELIEAAECSFNELLKAVKTCLDEKQIKPLNPYIIANTLWSVTHGISTLLIDGQIQAVDAFKGLPALVRTGDGSGEIDVPQIIESMGEILLTGLLQ